MSSPIHLQRLPKRTKKPATVRALFWAFAFLLSLLAFLASVFFLGQHLHELATGFISKVSS